MLVDANVTIDKDALTGVVSEAVEAYNETAEPPTDATVRFDDEQNTYVIDEESVGTAIEADKVVDACVLASRELRENVTFGTEAYKQPQVTKDDERLTSAADRANDILASDFHITYNGENVVTFTPEMKREWLFLDDDLELSVDAESILAYVNESEELAEAKKEAIKLSETKITIPVKVGAEALFGIDFQSDARDVGYFFDRCESKAVALR